MRSDAAWRIFGNETRYQRSIHCRERQIAHLNAWKDQRHEGMPDSLRGTTTKGIAPVDMTTTQTTSRWEELEDRNNQNA